MLSTHTQPLTDIQKTDLWAAYHNRRPTRVPVRFFTNPRVVLNDPAWNPDGVTFEQFHNDPETHLKICLQHEIYRREVIGPVSDDPCELPNLWQIHQCVFNVYEAAQFGAPVEFYPGQVPVTEPILTTPEARAAFYEWDIDHPLETGFFKERFDFADEMARIAEGMTFQGRPVEIAPFPLIGTDGPVTVACNLVGTDFLMELVTEPEEADRLMSKIVDAAIIRREAMLKAWGDRKPTPIVTNYADDSIAMLSTEMVRDQILPHHRRLHEGYPGPWSIHLCGDSTRHFKLLHDELNINSFDTGFPVDFGPLREQLGEDVEILGGPQIDLITRGTADEVYQRSVDILQSGIMRGGRFILREGNNLPPLTPLDNLAAIYRAAHEHGRYDN